MSTTTPSYSNVIRSSSQSWDLDQQYTYKVPHPQSGDADPIATFEVRIRIHHDTSYAKQSRARAEVWSPATLSWNEVASFLPAEWADDTDTEVDTATSGLWYAWAELVARAEHTLRAGAR